MYFVQAAFYIDWYYASSNRMKYLSLPTSLVIIGNAAFYSSGGYPDLVIPTSVTFIDQVEFISKFIVFCLCLPNLNIHLERIRVEPLPGERDSPNVYHRDIGKYF